MKNLLFALVLVGCSEDEALTRGSSPESRDGGDTGTQTVEDAAEPQEVEQATELGLQMWEADCSAGQRIDANLPIPPGTQVATYLRISDGYGLTLWTDAREGVLVWAPDGADAVCSYRGRDFEDFPFVEGVRVVWVAQKP